MSAHLQSRVWFLDLGRRDQVLLQALADHAHDDGSHVYPSIGYLAWKTGYNKRTLQRGMRSLEAQGLLVCVAEAGRHRAREYRIDLRHAKAKPPYRSEGPRSGEREGRHAAAPDQGGAASSAARGGRGDALGAAPVPPETSTGNVSENEGAGAREQALSSPCVDKVLEILETCPRFDVERPGVRVGVENAIAVHPDVSPIEAARMAVVWASDPNWRKTSPAATFLDALAHRATSRSKAAATEGKPRRPRSRTEEQNENVYGLLEQAAVLRAAGR